MPRTKKEDGAEPKKRSRTGCWPCKARKVKCGEEKPVCSNCIKNGETCDYSIRLNWGGRVRRDGRDAPSQGSFTFMATPSSVSSATAAHEHVFSSQHIATPAQPTSHPADQNRPTSNPSYDPRLTAPPHASPSMSVMSYDTASPPPSDFSPGPTSKRLKLSPRNSIVPNARNSMAAPSFGNDHVSPNSNYFSPSSIDSIATTPVATPGSSITSLSPFPPAAVPATMQDPPDLRRLSVKSLLADPMPDRPLLQPRYESHNNKTYGYDHGAPDMDIPRNDDQSALQPRSPDMRRPSIAVSEISVSSADGYDLAFEAGGYYASPVAVRISKSLDPLPAELRQNPMSLLYFHFFINHTSRIMVPHDCSENPLRRVLPRMAVRNKQLLHLVLAFSASHRAKLLGHPVPANRIADWMSDVLPALRQALGRPLTPRTGDASDLSTLAPLATAIMMASLEIMSPMTFEIPISWQNHLDIARQLIVNYGGLGRVATKADGGRDSAVFLISRWFAYLDVLGSLSGGKHRKPLMDAYLEDGGGVWLVNRDDEEVHRIDCFFGFSGTCIALLASVASIAAECDSQRIDPQTNQERPDWRPTDAVAQQAYELRQRLEASANKGVPATCMQDDNNERTFKTPADKDEIIATNQAFHWAGMLHLSRRVLVLPRSDPQVQDGVRKVLDALSKVRARSNAEACLLFPMFSAGCEALKQEDRKILLDRMKSIESWGMLHVARARTVMEQVWKTGVSWEVLVNGEFFG